jgi:hypothetical protein
MGRRALDFADVVERFNARDIVKPFESEINARGFHVYLHLPVGVWADAGLAGKAI